MQCGRHEISFACSLARIGHAEAFGGLLSCKRGFLSGCGARPDGGSAALSLGGWRSNSAGANFASLGAEFSFPSSFAFLARYPEPMRFRIGHCLTARSPRILIRRLPAGWCQGYPRKPVRWRWSNALVLRSNPHRSFRTLFRWWRSRWGCSKRPAALSIGPGAPNSTRNSMWARAYLPATGSPRCPGKAWLCWSATQRIAIG